MTRTAYEIADAAYKTAFWKWKEAQRAYHALEIGDDEYFPIKAEFDAALAEVEAAWEAEAAQVEEQEITEAETTDDETQMVLF